MIEGTVLRAYPVSTLATTMDRHLTYVAMMQHRDEAHLYAAREEFCLLDSSAARDFAYDQLERRLNRDGSKETALDYTGFCRAAQDRK